MKHSVSNAIKHEVRKLIIEALWHSSAPLSAERFHDEYVTDDQVTLAMVVYHARQLERDGIIEIEGGEDPTRRQFVLSGPDSGEAIRGLGLTRSGESN